MLYFSSEVDQSNRQSWGYARLASSITGGKASAVDFNILQQYCKPNSKALKLAKKNETLKKGLRRVKQVKIGGNRKTRKWSKKYKGVLTVKNQKVFSKNNIVNTNEKIENIIYNF